MADQNYSIHELVSKIERGEIRLPEMQRQYVWKQTQVRDLLDSLYRGYPSGTILTWETDEEVDTRDFAVDQSVSGGRFQLLLDGQQRLTSLSAIVRGQEISVRDRRRPIDLLFNLDHPDELEIVTEVDETDDDTSEQDQVADDNADDADENELLKRFNRMTFVVASNRLKAMPNWVSVTEVFKSNSDTPFLQKAGISNFDDPKYEKYAGRLKRLRDIKDYQYRVHVLDRSKSYEEVTEIFVRVNSLGAKLRSSDLALAQITAKWRSSLAIFQDFERECKDGGFDLGLGIHLKNLVSFATGQSRFKIVGGLSAERLQDGWEKSKRGMEFALNFLKSNAKITSPALLSSPFLIIAIAYFGSQRNYQLSDKDERYLRYWVYLANLKARYSRGSSETFLDNDLGTLRRGGEISGLLKTLEQQVGRLSVEPADLIGRNSRSAVFKSMFLAFHEDEAMDWHSQVRISINHAGASDALQFHHIFPQALLGKAGHEKADINDIANLAFLGGSTNRRISDKSPDIYLSDISSKNGMAFLTRQCIPADAALWKPENYRLFLEERRKLIAARLNKLLNPPAELTLEGDAS